MAGFGLALGIVVLASSGCSSKISESTRRAHLNKWCLSAATEEIDCSYATYEQCDVSRAGIGGTCYANPRLTEAAPAARRRSAH
jgi:hypothetical protein